MAGKKIIIFACAALLSASLLLGAAVRGVFYFPYPPSRLSPMEKYAALDMTGAIFGARRLAADIAWVELLQYYGSPEIAMDKEAEFKISWDMTRYLFGLQPKKEESGKPGGGEEEHYHPDFTGGVYPELYKYSLRVVNLDPFFSYVYLYGAGALAWNLDRPDEALKLLEEGIASVEKFSPEITRDVHQPFWQYHLYASAIIYKKSGKFGEMTTLLEAAARQPECPNMIKAILANIYQKNAQPAKALRLWLEIYDSKDPTYANRALSKISELKTVLNLQ